MRTIAVALGLLCSACLIDTDYSGTRFLCEDEPVCPDGFVCAGGVCVESVEGGGAVRRQLGIDAVPAEELVDFPILVSLSADRIDYARTAPGGADVRFFDSDATTLLAHEVEAWDEAGTSTVWVRVPRLGGPDGSEHIWMIYGDDDPPAALPASQVWTSDTVAVWHLAQAPAAGVAGEILDSTGSALHGDAADTMSPAALIAGRVGPGIAFTDADFVTMGDQPAFELPRYSWQMWISGDEAPVVGAGNGQAMFNADAQFNFSWDHNQAGFARAAVHRDAVGFKRAQIAAPLLGDTWYLVAATYDGIMLRIYLDGALQGEAPVGPPVIQAGPFALGNDPDGPRFSGRLDEVRVASVARSAAWLATDHLSMTDQLLEIGPEQPAP